jgi:alpha-tubulin suppressor-like RCC1 family protein
MKQLTCEMCGGTDLIKQEGVFLCQSCGLKYSVEEAKKMMIEGTVEVAGTVKVSNVADLESLMKRGLLSLEDMDWKQADEYFNKVLDISPEHAPAYIGLLCAELKVRSEEGLSNQNELFDEYSNYQKALRYANSKYHNKLTEYTKAVQERFDKKILKTKKYNGCISAGNEHTVGLKVDGTVVTCGKNNKGQCNTSNWCDIIAVSAGGAYTVGLKSDGTVVEVGNDDFEQCNTGDWKNIIAVSAGGSHTVGLKADGTVVAVGSNGYEQCNTGDWRNIIAVSAGVSHTVGLKADGTVVAVGSNNYEQCNTGDWRNIIAVSATDTLTIGLKLNGTVVTVGHDRNGRNNTNDWSNIIAISGGTYHTVGLKSDGTVAAVGKERQCNIKKWHDIVAISAGWSNTVGLKTDGTVMATGYNEDGQCNTDSWKNIGPVDKEKAKEQLKHKEDQQKKEQEEQRKKEQEEQRRQAEEQRRIEQSKNWEQQGFCRHCGGQMGGLFTEKCKVCGGKER